MPTGEKYKSNPQLRAELPEDVKSREGMVLFLAITELKNTVENFIAQVEQSNKDSVDAQEFKALKERVDELDGMVNGVKSVGKTLIMQVIQNIVLISATAICGSELVTRIAGILKP